MSRGYTPSLLYILKTRIAGRSFVYEFYAKGKKTLDVGCGEGEFVKHDKALIEGIDPNERAVTALTKAGYRAACGSATAMPYKSDSFEVVHCHNVIEHLDIETAYAMLKESVRVLAPGGHIVLSSEVVTKKFWDTFGHVKPYPPAAVIKLLRHESREEFDALEGVTLAGLFHIGDYHPNKVLYLVKFILGYLTPLFRREYFLVLRKN
jgi:SAM-dependent methyltransferase